MPHVLSQGLIKFASIESLKRKLGNCNMIMLLIIVAVVSFLQKTNVSKQKIIIPVSFLKYNWVFM